LKVRPRSEQEARGRLEQRGFPTSEIDAAMATAVSAGLIDDRAFARLWVTDRVEHRPLARAIVALELREKGIPADIADAALASEYPPAAERDLIARLARERFERLGGVGAEARARRTIAFLTRKGFAFSLVSAVVGQLERESRNG
jgi:regulatory protein